MTIFRVQHNKNYTTINNTITRDKRLSYKAKGIWLYAFSRPDDWEFHVNDLVNQSTDGKDSVTSGLHELEKCGYLIRNRERDEKGKLKGADWTFYETPSSIGFEPKPDFPDLGNPDLGNPPLLSTDPLPSTEKKQQQPVAAVADFSSENFNDEQIRIYQAQSAKIYGCLNKVDIPKDEKEWITQHYQEDCVKNAIEWAAAPSNPPTKGLVASIKFACKKGLSKKDLEIPKKQQQQQNIDASPYNKVYYREIRSELFKSGFKLNPYESNDYIEIYKEKLYFKDRSFLEQLTCNLRKLEAPISIFEYIRQCQQDLNEQLE